MKKNFLFIAFAVVLCWATSCNKEDFTNSDFIVSQGEFDDSAESVPCVAL